MDTSCTGLGPTLTTSSQLIICIKTLFPNKVTSWGIEGSNFNILVAVVGKMTHKSMTLYFSPQFGVLYLP